MKKLLAISKECKKVLYITGLAGIITVWLIVCAGEISVHTLIKITILIVLAYIAMFFDINTRRIPNTLVLTMIAGWLLLMTSMIFINTENVVRLLADSISGLLIGGGLFLLVYLISSKGLGGGDVKFMAAAGLYLGFAKTISVVLYGTVLAALTGLILIMLKRIGRKDTIPLAPFLFVGIMISVFSP